jgi:hypothetical protein
MLRTNRDRAYFLILAAVLALAVGEGLHRLAGFLPGAPPVIAPSATGDAVRMYSRDDVPDTFSTAYLKGESN